MSDEFPEFTLVDRDGFWVRAGFAAQDLVIVHDIYRDDAYRLRLIADYLATCRVIVDVGAHIGCFARLAHELAPAAEIICIEAEPRNLPALKRNAPFARIVPAACSYDRRPQHWWSAFAPRGCESTGGGTLRPQAADGDDRYRREPPPRIVTLAEALGQRPRWAVGIDLVKLDCEGGEFSILANADLRLIGFIVGEYHGQREWDLLRSWRLADWDYGHMSAAGDLGNFHLKNPRWPPAVRVDPPQALPGPHFQPAT